MEQRIDFQEYFEQLSQNLFCTFERTQIPNRTSRLNNWIYFIASPTEERIAERIQNWLWNFFIDISEILTINNIERLSNPIADSGRSFLALHFSHRLYGGHSWAESLQNWLWSFFIDISENSAAECSAIRRLFSNLIAYLWRSISKLHLIFRVY